MKYYAQLAGHENSQATTYAAYLQSLCAERGSLQLMSCNAHVHFLKFKRMIGCLSIHIPQVRHYSPLPLGPLPNSKAVPGSLGGSS